MEIKHSGKKRAKFDNIEKIFCIQRNWKGNQVNGKNIVSHSEIFKVVLNREMHTVLGRCAR